MDLLKRCFPFSFREKKSVGALAINIILYIVIGAAVGVGIGLLSRIPVVDMIIGIVGGLLDLYVFLGIILSILDYGKGLK